LEVRERYTLSGDALESAVRSVRSRAAEAIILSTCNRLEIYALLRGGERPAHLLEPVFGEDASVLYEHTYSYGSDDAVRHLFRVVSGINSLVLGEVQILGQVQRAWQAAHRSGAAGPVLSQLFHRAVALGKRAHSETSISRQPASISYAAIVLARRILGPKLDERQVLVIGTGEVGEGVARCLHDYGMRATLIAHRQIERAHDLARRYHADTASWDDLPGCLAAADMVISATSAPHYILQTKQVAEAVQHRGRRPLYLLDLALPRDIDPAVSDLPGVHLHNIDDLQAVVRATLHERESALPEIEGMIEVETTRFSTWLKSRSAAPIIEELHVQADEAIRRELHWAMAKMPDLTARERRVVEAMASRIGGKLLHGPIQWLKAQAENTPVVAEEPDYGMGRLTPEEITSLFYRDASVDGTPDITSEA
jgi:glutamyl-tRNA reductase